MQRSTVLAVPRVHVNRSSSITFGVLLFSLLSMLAVATSATAASVYEYSSSFGSFSRPSGVAVDEATGNVFVSDSGGGTVMIFGAAGGSPAGSIAPPYVIEGFNLCNEPSSVAIDNSPSSPSQGALYVADVCNSAVEKYELNAGTERYEFVESLSASPGFAEPTGVAVDDEGNVYVGDYGSSSVIEFGPTGTEIARYEASSYPLLVGHPSAIALDSDGDIFVQNYEGGAVVELSRDGSGTVAGEKIVTEGATGIAIDRSTDELFVALSNHVAVYDASGAFEIEFGNATVEQSERVAVNGNTGEFYLADRGSSNDVKIFAPVTLPVATTETPADVASTSASLRGGVDPEGTILTSCDFEYVTESAYRASGFTDLASGGDVPCQPAYGSIPADSSSHPVSAEVSGLQPDTRYRFRLTAANAGGPSSGEALDFYTGAAPVETTGSPVRGATYARLEGRVDPTGVATTYFFEYGTGGPCDSSPCQSTAPVSAGSADTIQLVSKLVFGLQADTLYHYRLVADSGFPSGPSFGGDRTVRTRPDEAALSHGDFPGPPGSDRAWEQVSLPDTGGNPVREASAFADDGEAAIYQVNGGTPLSDVGTLNNIFYAGRTPSGWSTSRLYPKRAEAPGNRWRQPAGASDLSRLVSLNFELEGTTGAYWSLSPGSAATKLYDVPAGARADDYFDAVSADGSRVVAQLAGSLDPAHPAASTARNLYDVSDGSPKLVSLMPDETVPTCGVTGGLPEGSSSRSAHWLSADGSLLFFPSRGSDCSSELQLYVRDLVAETTTNISGSPISGPACAAAFIKSTPGASFFWTQSRLVASDDAPVSCYSSFTPDAAHGDIYRYDVEDQSLTCVTCVVPGVDADVSVDNASLRSVARHIGVAEDGSRVYFRSPRSLLDGADAPGFYRADISTGELVYVAPAEGAQVGDAAAAGEAMTPDGAVLVFRSAASGLNPHNGSDNGGTVQYYRYDDRDRSLECVSCPQNGDPAPAAISADVTTMLTNYEQVGPNLTPLDSAGDFAFVTAVPLVLQDANTPSPGADPQLGEDVYEWRDGKLLLVTDGQTEWPGERPKLNGFAPSGRDLFFTAPAQYTADAPDAYARLYDARIGGGFSFPSPPPQTCGSTCQLPQVAPAEDAAGSESFAGPGNPRFHRHSCSKHGKPKHHRRCSRKHRRHRHHHGNRVRRTAR